MGATAVRWERGDDGIAVVVLDDPERGANGDRSAREGEERHADVVGRHLGEEDVLRGR